MSGSTVLIVDDEQSLARSAKAFLADHGYEAEVAGTGERALELLATLQPDVVFADVRLPGMSGLDLLKRIRAFDPVIPVIMLTAYGSIAGAVEAVKLGAFDYVKKPVDLEELKLLADRARETRLLKEELSYYRRRATTDVGFEGLVGESRAVRAVLERARQIAALDETPPVLLTGETGTGKGLLAHAIHAAGPRAAKPFIEVNCTALPATLMEAELFGHERGAFTDAKESKPGLVEAAEGGFLFLDEIGDVDRFCSSTRSATWTSRCRASCCGRSRSAPCDVWAACASARSTSASWPPPTAISSARWARSGFVRISISGWP